MLALTLTLVVLSQSAPPLVPAGPEAPPPGRAWSIVTPITTAVAGAVAARRYAADWGTDPGIQLAAFATGALVGVLAGYAAGYFAREGSTAARIVSVALFALSTGAVVYEAHRFNQDAHAFCRSFSFRLGGNWGPL